MSENEVVETEVIEEHRSIEEEIALAKQRMHRMQYDPQALVYWTGVLDGLQTAFALMQKKETL